MQALKKATDDMLFVSRQLNAGARKTRVQPFRGLPSEQWPDPQIAALSTASAAHLYLLHKAGCVAGAAGVAHLNRVFPWATTLQDRACPG